MGKFEQMLITAIRILNETISNHVAEWEKELNENNGYLKANYKINLYSMRKAVKTLMAKYGTIYIETKYIDRLVQEAKDYHNVIKNRNRDVEIVEESKQGSIPKGFISDYYITGEVLDLITNKYQVTAERMGIVKEFDKIIDNYNKYGKFFEKEIVIM